MQTSETSKPVDGSLTDTLSELESLITDQPADGTKIPVLKEMASGDRNTQAGIPILDELVEAEDVDMNEWGHHLDLPSGAADQMLHLIDTIEHRLTDELETLVQTLKSTMKDSIIDELKARLETSANSSTPTERLPGKKPD
ncbi:MAG: hypothetical protein A3G96_00080 [Gammaproteobacteria bacterium RIFCSPLOWO2_12_FULL_52_10]|nr:MAG: hypothetical protein A3G96_00080 [Gammaproteobacteria bacterium RIFCSPLOWO2_12_FULL_52_10]